MKNIFAFTGDASAIQLNAHARLRLFHVKFDKPGRMVQPTVLGTGIETK
jgi:hypothetical protein